MRRKWQLVSQALTPMLLVSLYYLWKHRATVSGKAEVDLASTTSWGTGCVISAFTKIKITGPFVMGRRVQIATGCFIAAMPSRVKSSAVLVELGEKPLASVPTVVCFMPSFTAIAWAAARYFSKDPNAHVAKVSA